jgi:hypothetical protein
MLTDRRTDDGWSEKLTWAEHQKLSTKENKTVGITNHMTVYILINTVIIEAHSLNSSIKHMLCGLLPQPPVFNLPDGANHYILYMGV